MVCICTVDNSYSTYNKGRYTMSRNTRNHARGDVESLKETINKLKKQIRNLTKQNGILKTENKTLQDSWKKTEKFLSEVTEDVSMEELISLAKSGQNLPKNKIEDKITEQEKARLKWKKWREENL